jgi:hypothetical protein
MEAGFHDVTMLQLTLWRWRPDVPPTAEAGTSLPAWPKATQAKIFFCQNYTKVVTPKPEASTLPVLSKTGEPFAASAFGQGGKMVEQRRFSASQFCGGIPSSFIPRDGRTPPSNPILKISGADGIRTHDPHVANVMLSQLSYCPKSI